MTASEGEGGADFMAPAMLSIAGMSAEGANDAPEGEGDGEEMFSRAGVAAE